MKITLNWPSWLTRKAPVAPKPVALVPVEPGQAVMLEPHEVAVVFSAHPSSLTNLTSAQLPETTKDPAQPVPTPAAVTIDTPAKAEEIKMAITLKTVEQAFASAVHSIVVGAAATKNALLKAATIVKADAPTVEALTSLIDPRAAVIERIGAALIGEVVPQVVTIADNVTADGTKPSVTITEELFAELKALATSLSSELATAKSSVA